jgi:hypothetical protein
LGLETYRLSKCRKRARHSSRNELRLRREFVEVDPFTLGTETFAEAPASERTALVKNNAVDKSRTLGLHGTAILSRFPLSNARILHFREQGHNWYTDEKKSKSKIESAKNKAAQVAFSEKIVREVRRGKTALILGALKSFRSATDPRRSQIPTKEPRKVLQHAGADRKGHGEAQAGLDIC